MDITIIPGKLRGKLQAIPSKSQAHRMLICAAFSEAETVLYCPETNQDIEATVQCLNALGAKITRLADGYQIHPVSSIPEKAMLDCRESGSTLRFMLPIAGALGVDTTFELSGRLPYRPLSPLWEEMERMGCTLTRPTANQIRCEGQLHAGAYSVDGSVSSQFITGLLFAMALIPGASELTVTGKAESKPYIEMTQKVLALFGVPSDGYRIAGSRPFASPGVLTVEGDWSNAAFFLAAKRLGCDIQVQGLSPDSPQGDRAIAPILEKLQTFCVIDAGDIPDLVPILAVTAGALSGATFKNIQRLRLKESDRVASVASMMEALGASVEVSEDTMTVRPAPYHGCIIDSVGDHRIAMSAAIAATVASGPVTVLGAQCVAKSYPTFWDEYRRLGGSYEQYIR